MAKPPEHVSTGAGRRNLLRQPVQKSGEGLRLSLQPEQLPVDGDIHRDCLRAHIGNSTCMTEVVNGAQRLALTFAQAHMPHALPARLTSASPPRTGTPVKWVQTSSANTPEAWMICLDASACGHRLSGPRHHARCGRPPLRCDDDDHRGQSAGRDPARSERTATAPRAG